MTRHWADRALGSESCVDRLSLWEIANKDHVWRMEFFGEILCPWTFSIYLNMTNSSLNVSEFMFWIPRFDGFRSGLSLSSSWGSQRPLHSLKLSTLCTPWNWKEMVISPQRSSYAYYTESQTMGRVQRVQRVQKLGKINKVTWPWYTMAHMKPAVMAAKLGLA